MIKLAKKVFPVPGGPWIKLRGLLNIFSNALIWLSFKTPNPSISFTKEKLFSLNKIHSTVFFSIFKISSTFLFDFSLKGNLPMILSVKYKETLLSYISFSSSSESFTKSSKAANILS